MTFPRGNVYATVQNKVVTRGDSRVIARANTWTVQNPHDEGLEILERTDESFDTGSSTRFAFKNPSLINMNSLAFCW